MFDKSAISGIMHRINFFKYRGMIPLMGHKNQGLFSLAIDNMLLGAHVSVKEFHD